MDKGYDSEAIHRLIREDLHANSVIPIRSWNNDIIGGTYRQEMARQFNDIIYPRRQLVENKFSVLKRKFNGDLKARRFLIQMKEIANKMIVCNIHRFLLFLIGKVFYRAEYCTFLLVVAQKCTVVPGGGAGPHELRKKQVPKKYHRAGYERFNAQ
jgi:hypothetical protein